MKVKVNNEEVNLKHGWGGWRVIYPLRNKDKSFNWFNFLTGGSWSNLIKTGVVIGLIIFIIFAYLNDVESCRHLLECGATCIENSPVAIWG